MTRRKAVSNESEQKILVIPTTSDKLVQELFKLLINHEEFVLACFIATPNQLAGIKESLWPNIIVVSLCKTSDELATACAKNRIDCLAHHQDVDLPATITNLKKMARRIQNSRS